MNKLITVFKIPELRLKIGITLLFLCIYRIGFHVPLPFINQEEMVKQSMQQGALGQILSYISVFSGGNFSQSTIFGLGIMPRSEEHTSELQSLAYLVCRLLLEKKKNNSIQ